MLLSLLPSFMFANAVTIAIGVATPTVGTTYQKGDTIKVIGSGVIAGTTVSLYWDNANIPWNGVAGLVNSTQAKASGAFEVWMVAPEATNGNHYLWVKDASGATDSRRVVIIGKVSLASSSGLVGDKVLATGYGFSGSETAKYFFSPATGYAAWVTAAVGGAGETIATGDTVTTHFTGTLAHAPVVPGSFGGGMFTDDGAGAITITAGGTGTINYITGAFVLDYTAAPAAVAQTLTYGYYTLAGVTALNQVTTNSLGTATATLTIPAAAVAAYKIVVFDADGVHAENDFAIGPVITINPIVGVVGQVIQVSGRGFFATATIGTVATQVRLYRGASWGAAVPVNNIEIRDMPVGGVVVDGSDRFTMSIIIPSGSGPSDQYFVYVQSSHGALDSSHTAFEITKQTKVSVTPTYGPQGSSITVTGTGFPQVSGTDVAVELFTNAGAPIAPNRVAVGNTTTAADGSWSKVFNVPAVTDGFYKIAAYVTPAAIANTTSFKIGTMYVALSVASGPTGKAITITGNGFTNNMAWNATIGSETLVSTGTSPVSGAGLINQVAYIPQMAAGTYTVTILDIDSGIKLTTTFTVTYTTEITLTPSTAPNGFNVSVAGKGFSQALAATGVTFVLFNKTSTGAYDRTWPMTVYTNYDANLVVREVATANASGIIRAAWDVPASTVLSKGTYYVNATDASANAYLGQATFIVGTVHEVCTPRKASFAQGEIVSFNMQHSFGGQALSVADGAYLRVYDPSNNLVFNGDAETANKWIKTGDYYTLPYSAQTAAGNQMTLADDAPTGTWTYKWYDVNGDLMVSGTFAVTQAATSTTDAQIQALAAQITAVSSSVTQLSATVSNVATSATAASNAATAASTAAGAAATAAQAATTAANAAGTKADAATAAANAAKTSADNAAAAASGLTTLVYAAIGASLVAALAAIVALMQISRKIA